MWVSDRFQAHYARAQSSALYHCSVQRSLQSAAVLLLLVLLAWPLAARAAERVSSFDSLINIQADGSLEVTERITVYAEGDQIKRGIVRTFPLRFTDKLGLWHPVEFSVLGVLRDGAPEQYRLEDLGTKVDVYLGQADYFLPEGEHSYEIRYRTSRQISYLPDFDELYWNVTGNEWQLPIMSASAVIRLPQPVPAESLHIEGYTGYLGARGQDYTASISAPGEGRIQSSKAFNVSEGLTVVMQWPKGVVAPPTADELAGEEAYRQAEADAAAQQAAFEVKMLEDAKLRAERDRKALDFLGVAGLLLVVIYYLATWLGFGLDSGRADPAALRAPPEDISPAALRYIRKMKFDPMCFTTSVISLASKGYLRIQQDKAADFSLQQLKGADSTLPDEEEKVLNALFAGANSRQVSSGNFKHFNTASNELQKVLKARYGQGYFRSNSGYVAFGACLSCGLGCAIFMFGMGSSLLFRTPIPVISLLLLWLVNWGYTRLIPKFSSRGRAILEQFEPLRNALSGGQPVELLMPSSAPMTPALFSQFLPYALAMDLQAAWAQQLEQQIKQAAQKAPPPAPGAVLQEQPGYYNGIDWFYNPYRRDYRYGQLVSTLSQNFNQKLSVVSTPLAVSSGSSGGSSRSYSGSSFSGGGGGGFSGGGGGGGGGRGW